MELHGYLSVYNLAMFIDGKAFNQSINQVYFRQKRP